MRHLMAVHGHFKLIKVLGGYQVERHEPDRYFIMYRCVTKIDATDIWFQLTKNLIDLTKEYHNET